MRANRGVAILTSRACEAIPRPTLHANVFTQLFGRCRPIARQPLPRSQSDAEPSRSNPTVLPNGMYGKLPHTSSAAKSSSIAAANFRSRGDGPEADWDPVTEIVLVWQGSPLRPFI